MSGSEMAAGGEELDYQSAVERFAQGQGGLSVSNIKLTDEGYLAIFKEPPPSQFHFVYKGIPFYGTVMGDEAGHELSLWGELGYIPFSAQSPRLRQNVLEIMRAARNLPHARMVQEPGQKILILWQSSIPNPLTPEAMVTEIVRFILESRAFVQLLGDYLAPPAIRAEVAAYGAVADEPGEAPAASDAAAASEAEPDSEGESEADSADRTAMAAAAASDAATHPDDAAAPDSDEEASS